MNNLQYGLDVSLKFLHVEWSPALNMEFGDLYTRYHDKGLEIYQISLDSDLHFWKNAASNLPWACVRDPQSVYSQTAALYNVKQLPAIFILDRKGNLQGRRPFGHIGREVDQHHLTCSDRRQFRVFPMYIRQLDIQETNLFLLHLIQVHRALATNHLYRLKSQVIQMLSTRAFRIIVIEAGGYGAISLRVVLDRLRLNNQLINFSVDSTETISFVADAGTFATSYSVEGSENCKAIKNITLAQLDANQAIHRLRKESESGLLADSVYSRQVLEAAEKLINWLFRRKR